MQKRTVYVFFILSLCLFFSKDGFCSKKRNPFPSDVHVFLIGFDGWGSYSLHKAEMPVLKQMMEQGCWTLKKRSVLPTLSAPNWASMFMGATPEIHGYTQNYKDPEIPSMIVSDNHVFPTISQLLCKQRSNVETGLFYQWKGLNYVADTLSYSHVTYLPVGKRKDWFSEINDSVCKYIKDYKPSFCTLIYNYPDHFGHAKGYDSNEFYESLKVLDKSLYMIIQSVKDAGLLDKSIFIVTSDHGGLGKTHGGKSLNEMETPFIIFGYNIKKGFEISDSMMQFDIAATIAYIFDLDVPQAWIGRPVKTVFEKTTK